MKKNSSNIKVLRSKLKLTLSEMGKYIGVSRSAVSNYENFRRFPRALTALKIVELANLKGINITLEYIYGISEANMIRYKNNKK
jgi:transcriptional regulator with XRE-family HTH domain